MNMALFKMLYELGILACVLAILVGAQIIGIYVEHWVDHPKRQHIRK
jgi:hypothetical protein